MVTAIRGYVVVWSAICSLCAGRWRRVTVSESSGSGGSVDRWQRFWSVIRGAEPDQILEQPPLEGEGGAERDQILEQSPLEGEGGVGPQGRGGC